MTRAEMIRAISERFPQLSHADVEFSVKEMLGAMHQALVAGDRIEIRGFGTFHLNYRPPRTGRNPKTGALVAVPGKHVPHFRAGKELREAIEPALANSPAVVLKRAA
ncbi:MAG: integration host factor subunit beta [Gammaproteobacteria bacterium]|jgi:integration host factor subunit beta|nr:integration host factor subunit beta [Gammaproteobacteria bacterium]MBU2451672.1 integration host factor subunit beta [Gammaproteobacteria bacterium]